MIVHLKSRRRRPGYTLLEVVVTCRRRHRQRARNDSCLDTLIRNERGRRTMLPSRHCQLIYLSLSRDAFSVGKVLVLRIVPVHCVPKIASRTLGPRNGEERILRLEHTNMVSRHLPCQFSCLGTRWLRWHLWLRIWLLLRQSTS